jgi:hypothetical protein
MAFATSPLLKIGVVGHRPNRLTAPKTVAGDITRLLDCIVDAAGEEPVMLASALAEGADMIAARQAVSRGIALQAVLPFARAEYQRDFPDAAQEFYALLQAAAQIVELPGKRHHAPQAYEAAALEILDNAALLIAVWDGGPSGGRGGTTESIRQATARKLPILWVDAAGQKKPASIPPGKDVADLVRERLTAGTKR